MQTERWRGTAARSCAWAFAWQSISR